MICMSKCLEVTCTEAVTLKCIEKKTDPCVDGAMDGWAGK